MGTSPRQKLAEAEALIKQVRESLPDVARRHDALSQQLYDIMRDSCAAGEYVSNSHISEFAQRISSWLQTEYSKPVNTGISGLFVGPGLAPPQSPQPALGPTISGMPGVTAKDVRVQPATSSAPEKVNRSSCLQCDGEGEHYDAVRGDQVACKNCQPDADVIARLRAELERGQMIIAGAVLAGAIDKETAGSLCDRVTQTIDGLRAELERTRSELATAKTEASAARTESHLLSGLVESVRNIVGVKSA